MLGYTTYVTLHKINNGILVLILVVNGYVIAAPFLPTLLFWVEAHGDTQAVLQRQLHNPQPAPKIPQPNHVVIPSMLLAQPIYDGPVRNQYSILDKGIWRWPTSSTPKNGGNTVLIGHRFTYTNPRGVFYYLNKVKVGDEIGVWWDDQRYTYKVSKVFEVKPNDTTIENNTADNRLTLFTCTPLWLPKHRLVVVAKMELP